MKAHRLLAFLLLTAAAAVASADSRLVGSWSSVDANNGALKGVILLEKGGAATLKAEAQPVLQGTWQAKKPDKLTLTMGEYGSSTMGYRFEKKRLVLTYDNGNQQHFEKVKAQK